MIRLFVLMVIFVLLGACSSLSGLRTETCDAVAAVAIAAFCPVEEISDETIEDR